MRNFILIVFIAIAFFGITAKAQLRPAQSQYLEQVGSLVNPSFEQGYKGWNISGTCTKSLVSDIPFLNKSLKLVCVNQTFSIKQEITNLTSLQGQQALIGLQTKATVNGLSLSSLVNGVRETTLNIEATTTYRRFSDIPTVLGATSNGIEIYTDVNYTGEIIIDNAILSLAPAGYIKTDYDDVPVGTILSYSNVTLPDGYELADGSCLTKADNQELFTVLETSNGECTVTASNDGFNLPDLRGKFIRGYSAGSTADPDRASRVTCSSGGATGDNIGSCQADATNKNGITVTNNSATTNTDTHDHNLNYASPSQYYYAGVSNGYSPAAGGTGDTRDSIDNDSHSHTVTSNVVLNSGDSETRPLNVYLIYMIKVKGRTPLTTVTQKSRSPDKAGFISWSSFNSTIEGHLPADGRCVLKTSYPDYMANVGTLHGECTVTAANDGFNLIDLRGVFPRVLDDMGTVAGDGGNDPSARTLGDTQADATAKNGLTVTNNSATTNTDTHDHTIPVHNTSPDTTGTNISAMGLAINATSSEGTNNDSHSHTVTSNVVLNNGDSETRPVNTSIMAYVRMVDNDVIVGTFENINSTNLIKVRYARSSTQSIADGDSDQTIIYNVLEDDNSDGAYNPSTGVFTATRPADLTVCASTILENAAWNLDETLELTLEGTAAGIKTLSRDETEASITKFAHSHGCKSVHVEKDETVYIQLYQGSGGALNTHTSTTANWITIEESATTESIIANLKGVEGFKIGDCKYSLLDEADFNSIHSGSWLRLSGQSISGTGLDSLFGISALPDATTNGAFIRQQGGNSAAMRTFQDEDTKLNGITASSNVAGAASGTLNGDSANNANGAFASSTGIITLSNSTGDGLNNLGGNTHYKTATISVPSHGHTINLNNDGTETRPDNIALNFYCRVD